MKRELFIHFSFLVSFFIFISIFKGWFNASFWPFWLGGLVGTLLPDVDHLIYIYFLRPQELTSQRVNYMLSKSEVWKTLILLAETRSERKSLIFHTAIFQIIFLILTFLVLTSSGSIFGRGLVLAFALHLIIDQAVDLMGADGLENWFRQINISLDKEKARVYWIVNLIIVLFFGFFL